MLVNNVRFVIRLINNFLTCTKCTICIAYIDISLSMYESYINVHKGSFHTDKLFMTTAKD